jgi:hypothetical protein
MASKVARREQRHARKLLRHMYAEFCDFEEKGQKQLELLVQSVPTKQLADYLIAKKLVAKEDLDEEDYENNIRTLTLRLLKKEAKTYCTANQDKHQHMEPKEEVDERFFVLGVVLAQLANKAAAGGFWSSFQKKLFSWAKKLLSGLWWAISKVIKGLAKFAETAARVLTVVVFACTSTAATAAMCYSAYSFMCSYVTVINDELSSALVAAAYAAGGHVAVTLSAATKILMAGLKAVCAYSVDASALLDKSVDQTGMFTKSSAARQALLTTNTALAGIPIPAGVQQVLKGQALDNAHFGQKLEIGRFASCFHKGLSSGTAYETLEECEQRLKEGMFGTS